MIGLCYILASIALLAVGMAGGLVAMLFAANARAARAELELGDVKLRTANQATATAMTSEKAQARRGDILEEEVAADATKPSTGSGVQRLLADIATPGTDPVAPSADAHCLTHPPPPIPGAIAELAELAPDRPATRDQLERLAGYTARLLEYSRRAYELCGSR